MSLRRVVNASPIIFLHHVGLLDQLIEPGVTVLVPDVVVDELGGLRPDDPAIAAVRLSPWIQVVATPPIPESLQPFRLDRGEAAVIAVALTLSEGPAEFVLDALLQGRRLRLDAGRLHRGVVRRWGLPAAWGGPGAGRGGGSLGTIEGMPPDGL